jgi:hypothetical protein
MDPPDPGVLVIEAAGTQPDDGILIGAPVQHAILFAQKVTDGAAPGGRRCAESVELIGGGVLQHQCLLGLPGILRLSAQPDFPLRLVSVAQRLSLRHPEVAVQKALHTFGRRVLAVEADPAD